MCLNMLRAYGVTAVLNAAQGEMSDWNYINTKASYYAKDNIRFLGVPAFDSKTYPIRSAHDYNFSLFYHLPNAHECYLAVAGLNFKVRLTCGKS